MRRIDQLITQVRRATETVEFSDTVGITEDEYIQYLNDAQTRIQSLIVQTNPDIFEVEKEIATIAEQEAYDLPDNAFLGTRLEHADYNDTSQSDFFTTLRQARFQERVSGTSGVPRLFIRRGSEILLQPKPSSAGTLRITYTKRLPALDIRRGVVGSVTLDSGTSTITTLSLDTTQNIDESEIEDEGYITVVDRDGAQQMRKIPVLDVNSSSGLVTLQSGFVFEDGETISVGDYVVAKKDGSTHSELPDICERYLLEYAVMRILNRDSSNDVATLSPVLQQIEIDIVNMFAEPDGAVDRVTILNDHGFEEDW